MHVPPSLSLCRVVCVCVRLRLSLSLCLCLSLSLLCQPASVPTDGAPPPPCGAVAIDLIVQHVRDLLRSCAPRPPLPAPAPTGAAPAPDTPTAAYREIVP
jgi:hypothetical protein